MKELSTERAIEALYTIRAYYASLTAGYPKGKDRRGIGDVMCSEIANSCLMAIKALEQQPNLQPTCNQLATDCISRQAVLDRINRLIEVEKKQGTDDWRYGQERVNAYEAMLHMVESEYLYPSVEPDKCGDCVSRQDVLDLAERGKLVSNGNYKSVRDAINGLPSVEPERKPGKWIWDKRTGTYHCSECGHDPLHEDVGEIEEYKYCMNCGAEMEVDG